MSLYTIYFIPLILKLIHCGSEEVNDSPIEQVRLTVPITDDPTMQALTFRTWVLGMTSCTLLAFLNQFFGYRQNALYISSVSAQIAVMPLGKLMAAWLPTKSVKLPGTTWSFSLNPGPFNIKEHVLITIFANSGSLPVYAVNIITIVKASTFYNKKLHPLAAMLLTQTTQLVGTIIASSTYFGTAWWLLETVDNICDPVKLPEGSPWTCPGDHVFYSASIIWGVVSPNRMFGRLGLYEKMNYFFLVGLLAPVPIWALSRIFPEKKWIKFINMPVILSATASMPPARAVNYLMWGAVGIIFNIVVYRRFKGWWARHNYVLSAGLDAGVAFMAILTYFALQIKDINGIKWWGLQLDDHCPLAICPTAPGITGDDCPLYQ